MNDRPGQILSRARKAFSEKNYKQALEDYNWFFDNALSINQAYYGVRLSYCLGEWAELAKVYPPAEQKLIEKKVLALNNFESKESINDFHDYSTICEFLNCTKEPVEQFLKIHNSDKKLAKKLFRYVYEPLARNEQWDLCREYIGDVTHRYDEVFEILDHCIEFSKEKEGDSGRQIEEDGIKHAREELLWILKMLSHVNETKEYIKILNRMKDDLESRGYADVFQELVQDAPDNFPHKDA